ncbi:MAG: GatB/YqeY domain-containing protein [Candidatus Cloacimonadales bacterium]|nr:GatB/YqeY domain-containing protein [Candidatus Cloacimonadales bacterium]
MIKQIDNDIIAAQRSKDKARLTVLRSLKSALKYEEIKVKKPLSEEEAIVVLQGQVKSRQQAIGLYIQGKRPELAEIEQKEIDIIGSYLPQLLSEEELVAEVDLAVQELEKPSMKDMGSLMKTLKEKLGSRADGKTLSMIVRAKLQF